MYKSVLEPPLVSLRDVTITAVEHEATMLLDLPALDIYRGDRVVITGPSGSGKTMLLSCLTGQWAPGLVFSGRRECAAERIGLIPQHGLLALHPLMRIQRQLCAVTGASTARVEEVLEGVGLDEAGLQRRRPSEISGGQAQRVAIALSVLSNAPLVLADEPTSALDNESRDQILELLSNVISPDHALVIATHDLAVVDAIATRRLVVNAGRVREVGCQESAVRHAVQANAIQANSRMDEILPERTISKGAVA